MSGHLFILFLCIYFILYFYLLLLLLFAFLLSHINPGQIVERDYVSNNLDNVFLSRNSLFSSAAGREIENICIS